MGLAEGLKCSMLLAEPPGDLSGRCELEEMSTGSTILGAAHRPYNWVLPGARQAVRNRLAGLPLTKNEVRANVYKKSHEGETATVHLLGAHSSGACRISGVLKLGRPLIRQAMSDLNKSRLEQATLAGTICATRFKFFDETTPGFCALPSV